VGTVWVEGIDEINRLSVDLNGASVETTARVGLVIRKVAADIERDAKGFAPVDTGALRSSISSTVRALSAEIGPTVHYGRYVEWGTSRMAPRAFMGPALDRNTPGFVAAIGQAGARLLDGS
jgi:HK97 gp10 family phage protein